MSTDPAELNALDRPFVRFHDPAWRWPGNVAYFLPAAAFTSPPAGSSASLRIARSTWSQRKSSSATTAVPAVPDTSAPCCPADRYPEAPPTARARAAPTPAGRFRSAARPAGRAHRPDLRLLDRRQAAHRHQQAAGAGLHRQAHHGGEDHAYVLDTARDKGFSASQPMLRRCEKILSRQVVHNFFFHFLWSIFATLIR